MGKKVISYIIVLILIAFLTTSTLIAIFSQTILKEKYILKMLEKNDYYTKTYNEIMETFKDNTIQSGLEEKSLEGLISQEKVKNDVNALIKYMYTGTTLEIDTEPIKEHLRENIDEIIKQNNKKLNKDEQIAIDKYINTISQIYKDGIMYFGQYVKPISEALIKIQNIINKIKLVIYGVSIILIILLIVINKKESLKYISIGSMATGIVLIIPKIIESSTMQIQNILLFNATFSNTLISIAENIILYLLIAGIAWCILGLILSIISYKKEK